MNAPQVAHAFARVQGTPQAVQFVTLSSRASQPFGATPSQLPHPAAQDGWQAPPLQAFDTVPAFVWQAVPQLPHALGSVWRFRQVPAQHVSPGVVQPASFTHGPVVEVVEVVLVVVREVEELLVVETVDVDVELDDDVDVELDVDVEVDVDVLVVEDDVDVDVVVVGETIGQSVGLGRHTSFSLSASTAGFTPVSARARRAIVSVVARSLPFRFRWSVTTVLPGNGTHAAFASAAPDTVNGVDRLPSFAAPARLASPPAGGVHAGMPVWFRQSWTPKSHESLQTPSRSQAVPSTHATVVRPLVAVTPPNSA